MLLGPFCFLQLFYSLNPICDNSRFFKYADDVTILHFLSNACEDNLQNEFSHVESWSKNIGLSINYEKCSIMNCTTKKFMSLPQIPSRETSEIIVTVSHLKLLGITFSEDLSWREHISIIVKKCLRRLYILRNLKRCEMSPKLMFECYVSFIRSVLIYGYPTFCKLPKCLLHNILRVEKLAARFFRSYDFNDFSTVSENLCKRLYLKIESVGDHPLRAMFHERTPTLRNPHCLREPRSKTTRYDKSFIRFGR